MIEKVPLITLGALEWPSTSRGWLRGVDYRFGGESLFLDRPLIAGRFNCACAGCGTATEDVAKYWIRSLGSFCFNQYHHIIQFGESSTLGDFIIPRQPPFLEVVRQLFDYLE